MRPQGMRLQGTRLWEMFNVGPTFAGRACWSPVVEGWIWHSLLLNTSSCSSETVHHSMLISFKSLRQLREDGSHQC